MNKKLRWIIIGVVAVIAILAGLKLAGVIGNNGGTKVSSEKAVNRTITETVNASGKIYPEVEVKVSSDVSGEIVELNVDEGDSVKRGQVLAKIYADIYVSQRDQVAAGVNQAKAQFQNSKVGIEALKATLDQAESNYQREKKLLRDKVISASEFEQAQQAYLAALSNFNAAKEGLKGNDAAIKNAEAQLTRADKDLSRTTITAPMNGVVSLLEVKKGERVVGTAQMTGTEMMRIADMNSIVAQVDVGENDIPKVQIGDTAVVQIDAYNDRKFKGLVFKIANPSTSSSTSTTSDVTNYKVHIRLFVDGYRDLITKGVFPFRPGMSATADIQTKTLVHVLSVPLNAVTTRDKKSDKLPKDKKAVDDKNKDDNNNGTQTATNTDDLEEVVFLYNANDKTIRKVKVKTGIQDLDYIQILEGLKEGDEIITGPYNAVSKTLKTGDKVKIVPKEKLYDTKTN